VKLAILATAVVALCTCGSAAALPPQYQPSDRDVTWARSLVLTATDVGSPFAVEPSGTSPTTGWDFSCGTFDPDQSDLVLSGDGGDAAYVRMDTGAVVLSFGGVWATPDYAQADWDRLAQAQLADCLGHAFASGSMFSYVGTTPMTLPAIAPRTTGFRIQLKTTITVPAKKTTARGKKSKKRPKPKPRRVTVVYHIDLVELGNGRASALLLFGSFAALPIGDAREQELATVMAGRMATDPAATQP
jgi:hypothetical protein